MVAACGHMVPMDQPVAALDLLGRFLDGRSFYDKEQAIVPIPEGRGSASHRLLAKSELYSTLPH